MSEKNFTNATGNWIVSDTGEISYVGTVTVTGGLNAAQLELPGPTSQNISSRIIFGNFNVGEKWDSNNRPNDRVLAFRSGNVDMLSLNNGNDTVYINKGILRISRMSIQKATSDGGNPDDSLGIVWDSIKRVNIDSRGNAKFEGEIQAQDFLDADGNSIKVNISNYYTKSESDTKYQPKGNYPQSVTVNTFVTMTQSQYDALSSKDANTIYFTLTPPPGEEWTNQSDFTTAVGTDQYGSGNRMTSVVWDGTQFCAVGYYGICATSPDGVTWTEQPSLASAVGSRIMNSVTWDGTQFCAVGSGGRCATSPDGVTWTQRSSLERAVSYVNMYSVTWTGSQFCAVGGNGGDDCECATSPNGIVWTRQPSFPSATGKSMNSVIWNGSQFCAVGNYAKCATSPDGVTWTAQPSLASAVNEKNHMNSITWDGTQFCTVGKGDKCATSPDGVTWTLQRSLASAVDSAWIDSVTWSGTQFCAVGMTGSCATSPDGVTWTGQPSLASAVGLSVVQSMNSVTWDGTQFCAVGDNGKCATSP